MEYILVPDRPLTSVEAKAYVDHFYGPHWKPVAFKGVFFDPDYWDAGWPHTDHAALIDFMVKANA